MTPSNEITEKPIRYRSRLYPHNRTSQQIQQEYLFQNLSWLIIWILIVLYQLFTRGELLLTSAISLIVLVIISITWAQIKMRSLFAEIVFWGNAFAIRTVQEVVDGKITDAYFPVSYSAISLVSADLGTIHYLDRIIHLHKTDWPDFDGILKKLQSESFPN